MDRTAQDTPVQVFNADATSPVILVCEHASSIIPPAFDGLGLDPDARQSHVAWDPGAMAVARAMSERLDAVLVAGAVSRLVYDLNRAPDADDAMPERSEIYNIPGNRNLSEAQRADRVAAYYAPFKERLARAVAATANPILVTVHSFTPVYNGTRRAVEIGVLHDADARLADAMLQSARSHTSADVRRNEPYGPADGVTHTLAEHGLPGGHLNVMLEVRNDLIWTAPQQVAMAADLAAWLADAITRADAGRTVTCLA